MNGALSPPLNTFKMKPEINRRSRFHYNKRGLTIDICKEKRTTPYNVIPPTQATYAYNSPRAYGYGAPAQGNYLVNPQQPLALAYQQPAMIEYSRPTPSTAYSPVNYNAASTAYNPPSPSYNPPSSAYNPPSSAYNPPSPVYGRFAGYDPSRRSPVYKPASPVHIPTASPYLTVPQSEFGGSNQYLGHATPRSHSSRSDAKSARIRDWVSEVDGATNASSSVIPEPHYAGSAHRDKRKDKKKKRRASVYSPSGYNGTDALPRVDARYVWQDHQQGYGRNDVWH